MSKTSIDVLLKSTKVLICVGTGGVGKTTTAAALGVRAADLGLNCLVLTIDPAQRLATSLGLVRESGRDPLEPVKVPLPGATGTGSLSAMLLESQQIFDRFLQMHIRDPKTFERLSKNELYIQLSTRLSGSQEFTALEMLLRLVESKTFDLIILDTPPAQHAVDFLTAPNRIQALFQDSITKWFIDPGTQDGILGLPLIGALVGRSTRIALKSLEVLTGGKFIDALVDFFAAIRSVQTQLRERLDRVDRLLRSKDTQFVLVSSYERAKLNEAAQLGEKLSKEGYHFSSLIVNRALSHRISKDQIRLTSKESQTLFSFYEQIAQDFEDRVQQVAAIEAKIASQRKGDFFGLSVPNLGHDVVGLEDLHRLSLVLGQVHL